MKILVVGANGATGVRLVKALLNCGQYVRAIVRNADKLPDTLRNNERLEVVVASILDLSDKEMEQLVTGCDAVASCLGHTPTFKGVFGKPHRLVTEATRRLCLAIKANNTGTKTKYVLMNTVANRNRNLNEQVSFAQKTIILLLRHLVPPHADNELAAEYLRAVIGQNDEAIEWVAVRPSTLIENENTSEIVAYLSPQRSVLNDGQISRINVGQFMADLITNASLWEQWKGQMPVIYNKGTEIK